MRLCLEFKKEGILRFISHLELMRLYERALRRSLLPCSYSQGFNPHPLMSFASPLAVGIASKEEYLELWLKEEILPQIVRERLNMVLPSQVAVIKAFELPDNYPSLMSLVERSIYSVFLEIQEKDFQDLERSLVCFQMQNEILTERKRKNGIKVVDLKPKIFALKVEQIENFKVLKMDVATGSEQNVRPDEVINSLESFCQKEIAYSFIQRERLILKSGFWEENFVTRADY